METIRIRVGVVMNQPITSALGNKRGFGQPSPGVAHGLARLRPAVHKPDKNSEGK